MYVQDGPCQSAWQSRTESVYFDGSEVAGTVLGGDGLGVGEGA